MLNDDPSESDDLVYKLVVLGNSGVGKSSLLNMLAGHELFPLNDGTIVKQSPPLVSIKECRFMGRKRGARLCLIDTVGVDDSLPSTAATAADKAKHVKHLQSIYDTLQTEQHSDIHMFLICFDAQQARFTAYTRELVAFFRRVCPGEFTSRAAIVFNKWASSAQLQQQVNARADLGSQFQAKVRKAMGYREDDPAAATVAPCYFIDSFANKVMLSEFDNGEHAFRRALHPLSRQHTIEQIGELMSQVVLAGAQRDRSSSSSSDDENTGDINDESANDTALDVAAERERQARDDEFFSKDLSYFSQANMSTFLLENFATSLPDHLKSLLRRTHPAAFNYMWVIKPLQGYELEPNGANHPGLIKVSFWYGASVHYNWVPFTGTLLFGLSRWAGDNEWKSLYFDSLTFKCLGVNVDEAARALYDRGRAHMRVRQYDQALEYFRNARRNATTEDAEMYERACDRVDDILANSRAKKR